MSVATGQFHPEISILKNIFQQNGYPYRIFDNSVKKFTTINLIQKQKIKTAKMKTIDA